MKWHDCKTDPPKKMDGMLYGIKEQMCHPYIKTIGGLLIIHTTIGKMKKDEIYGKYGNLLKKIPYKWAEVNLDEDD